MPHAVLVQQILHDLATGSFVGDAERLVLDVRPQAVGVDLDGGLKRKDERLLNRRLKMPAVSPTTFRSCSKYLLKVGLIKKKSHNH